MVVRIAKEIKRVFFTFLDRTEKPSAKLVNDTNRADCPRISITPTLSDELDF
jgi:hypothetical protein